MRTDALDRECRVFTVYLTGQEPTAYVLAKYRDCHARVQGLSPVEPFDRLLAAIAVCGPVAARFTDCYAARFRQHGPLRRKLVLILALLECAFPSARYLDGTSSAKPVWALLWMAWAVTGSMLMTLASVTVLLPADLALRAGKTR